MGMTTPTSSSQFALPAAPCRRPGLSLRRSLRVTRVFEDTRQPGQAGRMAISGRLADVCAELDRLARLESR